MAGELGDGLRINQGGGEEIEDMDLGGGGANVVDAAAVQRLKYGFETLMGLLIWTNSKGESRSGDRVVFRIRLVLLATDTNSK